MLFFFPFTLCGLDNGNDNDDDTNQSNAFMGLVQLLLSSSVRTDQNEDVEIHKVRCGICGSYPIKRDRYRCLNCEGLDVCGRCFRRRKESGNHKSGHAFVHFELPGELFGRAVNDNEVTLARLQTLHANDAHESIYCDGCNSHPIKGLRFKCDSCSDYDLCQQCVNNNVITRAHKLTHSLIVLPRRTIREISEEDIRISNELKRGAFGKQICRIYMTVFLQSSSVLGSTYKARWVSKKCRIMCRAFALKRTEKTDMIEKSFLRDLAASVELSGTYILKVYGYTKSQQGDNIRYMVITERMSRGSLAKVIEESGSELSLRRRLDIARSIAAGMRKIHEHHLIHRDIQPDNIFITENDVPKIGDMGIARFFDPLDQQTQISRHSYMPPEYFHGTFDQTLDIFTFGLTLNELFTSTKHSFQTVPTGEISFYNLSPIFGELISRCAAYDPRQRPTSIEVEKVLDVFADGFNELVLMKHPSYMSRSTREKDKIFLSFYEKFHPRAMQVIERAFPPELPVQSLQTLSLKINRNVGQGKLIQYPVQ